MNSEIITDINYRDGRRELSGRTGRRSRRKRSLPGGFLVALAVLLIAAGIAKPRALLLPEADEIGADPDTVKLVEEMLDAAAGAEIEIPEDLPAALESIRSAYHREAGT